MERGARGIRLRASRLEPPDGTAAGHPGKADFLHFDPGRGPSPARHRHPAFGELTLEPEAPKLLEVQGSRAVLMDREEGWFSRPCVIIALHYNRQPATSVTLPGRTGGGTSAMPLLGRELELFPQNGLELPE